MSAAGQKVHVSGFGDLLDGLAEVLTDAAQHTVRHDTHSSVDRPQSHSFQKTRSGGAVQPKLGELQLRSKVYTPLAESAKC